MAREVRATGLLASVMETDGPLARDPAAGVVAEDSWWVSDSWGGSMWGVSGRDLRGWVTGVSLWGGCWGVICAKCVGLQERRCKWGRRCVTAERGQSDVGYPNVQVSSHRHLPSAPPMLVVEGVGERGGEVAGGVRLGVLKEGSGML